jgi:hypothetical protein
MIFRRLVNKRGNDRSCLRSPLSSGATQIHAGPRGRSLLPSAQTHLKSLLGGLTPELSWTAQRRGVVVNDTALAEPRSGLGLNDLLGANQFVVLGMATDPEPYNAVRSLHTKRTDAQADAD